jgi:hypothetical protein
MLEPTHDAYFFDVCERKEHLRFYGPFNTSLDLGRILGSLIPALFLLILPFKYIFLVFSIFMLLFFIISYKIKNVIESKRH